MKLCKYHFWFKINFYQINCTSVLLCYNIYYTYSIFFSYQNMMLLTLFYINLIFNNECFKMSIVENNEIVLYCTPIIRTDLLYISQSLQQVSICMPNGWHTNWSRPINFYSSLPSHWSRVNAGTPCNEMNVIMRKYSTIVYQIYLPNWTYFNLRLSRCKWVKLFFSPIRLRR